MVSDVQTPGLAEADLDIGLETDLEDAADASPEADEDPVAALRAELAATNAKLDGALRMLNPEQINRALGHIPALQRELDGIKKGANPLAEIDPRLSESEDAIAAAATALLASDFVDDGAKGTLRQAMQRMAANRDARKDARLRREVLEEANRAREGVQAPDPNAQLALEVAQATQRLMDFADGKNVPWDSIDVDELQFKPGESLTQAMTRVRKVITDLAGESAATERTANRRRAAGAGSPASAGVNGYTSQRAVDLAHMEGRLTSAQVNQLRSSGRYAALPY